MNRSRRFRLPYLVSIVAALIIGRGTASTSADGPPPVAQTQPADFGTVSIGPFETGLVATGGNGTYTWTVSSGSLPPGLSLRTDIPPGVQPSASALLSGVATTPGTYTFTLHVTSGGQSADQASSITVSSLRSKDWSIPPLFFVGSNASYQLTAVGNAGGVTWTPLDGLPPGLSLNSSGQLSGTATADGDYSLSVSLNDGTSVVTAYIDVEVNVVNITTSGVLPNATQNQPYNTSVTAAGGTGPYTFQIFNLPNGLTYNANTGAITGTVTGGSGRYDVEVDVSDHVGNFFSKNFGLAVQSVPAQLPSLVPYGNRFDDCIVGYGCVDGVAVTSGSAPFSWTASGLPPGVTLRPAGDTNIHWITPGDAELWGSPSTAGDYNVTLTVTDGNGVSVSNTFPWHVTELFGTSGWGDGSIGVPYSQSIRLIGGVQPYSIVQLGGHLPAGLTLDLATATLSGTPLESGSFHPFVRGSDSAGHTISGTVGFFVDNGNSPVVINRQPDLGTFNTGLNLNQTFTAGNTQCCVPPNFVWTVLAGNVPPGLFFTSGGSVGVLSGVPTTVGDYSFLVRALDTVSGKSAARQFYISISTLNISTGFALPFGNKDTAYSQTLTATGAQGPLVWTLEQGSYLPPGLTLASNGSLTGSPTSVGMYFFTIDVTDGASHTSRGFSIGIYPTGTLPPVGQTQSPNFGTWSMGEIETPLTASGGNGTYSWTIASGSLPPGLSIRSDPAPFFPANASGIIGVATTPGTYNFVLRVSSAGQDTDIASTMTITPLRLKGTQFPDAFVGAPYSQTLVAVNNTGTVTFAPNGLPPAGLILSSSGVISGTPANAGNFSLNFSMTDGGTTVFRSVPINVFAVNITTPGALPNAIPLTPYYAVVTATGGAGGYTYSASGLPNGLSINANTGVISGIATTSAGKFGLQVTARDSANVSYTKRMSIVVTTGNLAPFALNISPYGTFFDDCTVGVPCHRGVNITGGVPPYSWSVNGLPPGLSIRFGDGVTANFVNPYDGEIWGSVALPQTANLEITVTDGLGQTSTNTFPLKVSTLSLPRGIQNGKIGVPYSQTLRVLGGTLPYSATQVGGVLPQGLAISSGGVISGTPTESGNFSLVMSYADSANPTAATLRRTTNFSITGAGPGGISIGTGSDFGSLTVGQAFNRTLNACCAASIVWSQIGGTLPTGVTLSSNGQLSGSLQAEGVFTFFLQATDGANPANFAARQFTINVTPLNPIQFLALGFVGTAYNQNLTATGGTGALTWTLAPNSILPPGVVLGGAGTLTGTPTKSGQFIFSLTVGDTASHTFVRAYNLSVYPATSAVTQTQGTNFGTFSVGQLELALSATGGTGFYGWTISSGSLPPGLVIRSDLPTYFPPGASAGIIGVATTAGTYNFTVTSTSGGKFADQPSTIKIVNLAASDGQLPDSFVNVHYSFQLHAQGSAGPFTWAVNGPMPGGLTLSSTGLLSGTPTTAGPVNVNFSVTDGVDTIFSGVWGQTYAFQVTSPDTLPNATQNAPYAATLTASGGVAPYTFNVGGLPNGLFSDPNGSIGGAVNAGPGKYNLQINVRDNVGAMSQKTIALTVVGVVPTLPSVMPYGGMGIDDCTIGVTCSRGVAVFNGGVPPYSWTVTGVPPGMAVRTGSANTLSWITSGDVELWGRPTALGTYNVTFTVMDGNNVVASNTFPVKVSPMVQTQWAQNGTLGMPYSIPLRVIGGTGYYSGAQTAGLFPFGLSLNPSSLLVSGTPLESGPFNPRFTFTDTGTGSLKSTNYFFINGAGAGASTMSINTYGDLGAVQPGLFYSRTLNACCAAGTVVWSQAGGTLPPGLSFGSNGLLSGTPTTIGTYTFLIRATDSANAANYAQEQFTFGVTSLFITTNWTLPFGNLNVAYTPVQLNATGGAGPIAWTLAPDNFLPPGLTVSAGGLIAGTPTATGQFSFRLIATDSANTANTQWLTFSLSIYPQGSAPPVVQLQESNFGTFSVGRIETALRASGGNGAFQWSVLSGTLPPGLVIRTDRPSCCFPFDASAGIIGVATTPGTYNFVLRVTSAGQTFDQPTAMKIVALASRDGQLPDVFVGQAFAYQLQAQGNAGAVTWTPNGPLPDGLTLSSSGLLSGTPTTLAQLNVNFSLNDGVDTVFSGVWIQSFAVRVTGTGTLPNATQGAFYSTSVGAAGGSGGYTFFVGSLPNGLGADNAGVISGTVSSGPGKYNIQVTAIDSSGFGYTRNMALTVVGVPPVLPSVNPYGGVFDDCTIGVPCTIGVGVNSGGKPAFSWNATGLPPGMILRTGEGNTRSWITPGDAELWGRPTATGLFNVTLTVTDFDGVSATNTLPLRVSPLLQTEFLPGGALNAPYQKTLRVIGGSGSYTAAQTGGLLPAGLGLNANTFEISGAPLESGNFNPRIAYTDTDATTGHPTLTTTNYFFISGAGSGGLSINTGSDLGSTLSGSFYSRTLNACCAGGSILWLQIGGTLPSGVSLASNGTLSGTPSTPGVYTFLAQASDSSNFANSAARQFTLNVTTISISSPFTLPFGNVNVSYNQALVATGGSGALTWTLAPNNVLPPGLTLSSAGVIAGTPTNTGQYSFTITVTDASLHTQSRTFSLSIYPQGSAPAVVQTSGPNFGVVSIGTTEIPLSAAGGDGTFSWSVFNGTLPPGISLRTDKPSTFPANASAGLIGVATTAGTYNFTLRVQSAGQIADVACTLRVTAFTLKREPFNLPDAYVGNSYNFALTPANAAGPVTFTPIFGLPPGITLDSSGALSGTPTAAGFFTFVFNMSDGVDTIGQKINLSISAIRITTPGRLPNGAQSVPYSTFFSGFTTTGGTPPYTYFAPNGLPFGLTLNPSGTISGAPASFNVGKSSFSVTATDANNVSYTRAFSIDVVGPGLMTINHATYTVANIGAINDCTIGNVCSRAFAVVNGGVAPFTWSATNLPPGMSLRPGAGGGRDTVQAGAFNSFLLVPGDIEIWGVPTTADTFPVTLTVMDSLGATASQTYPIKVSRLAQPTLPINPTINVAYSQTLRIVGGAQPYSAVQVGGTLPTGMSLNSNTLVLSGTPLESGTFNPVIRFTDAGGETLTVTDVLNVNGNGTNINDGSNLGTITAGVFYSRFFTANVGVPPFSWAFTGGTLPPGLSLLAGGTLAGVPTTPGVYTFVLSVSNAGSFAAGRQFTLTVAPSGSLLSIANAPVPFGTINTPYSLTFTATGGAGPLTWSLAPFNTLPPGVSLSSGGVLAGTPTALGRFSFTITVTDGTQTAVRSINLPIVCQGCAPPLDLVLSGPNFAGTQVLGVYYAVQLLGSGGVPPYTFSLTPTAPVVPGMRVQSGPPLPEGWAPGTGEYFGVLTAPGTYTTSLRVTDSLNTFFDRTVSFTVSPLQLLSQNSLPGATRNAAYTFTLTATGGAPPYTWSATGLPSGTTLSAGGVLSGSPTVTGSFSPNITITDSASHSLNVFLNLAVGAIAIAGNGALPQGTVGVPYNQALNASGCAAACTWSASGDMPPGLTLSSNGVLSGTPLTASLYDWYVTVSSTNGSSTKRFALVIAPRTPWPDGSSSFSDFATVGDQIHDLLFLTEGTPPLTWSVQSGSLPPGVTLDGPGDVLGSQLDPGMPYLVGRMMQAGTYHFVLAVKDAANVTRLKDVTLTVSPLSALYWGLPISGTSLHFGVAYTQQLGALGGKDPYTWALASGSTMPPGLSLTNTGVVSGTPTSAGLFDTRVRITDSNNDAFEYDLGFEIDGPGIAGRVTESVTGRGLENVAVQIYDASGALATTVVTDPSGDYVTHALASGTYYARTSNVLSFVDRIYNAIVCLLSCDPTTGTAITVTSTFNDHINFTLSPGGQIAGAVTSTTNTPLAGVAIRFYDSNGTLISTTVTNGSGVYTSNVLPPGTYYARTFGAVGYLNRLYNDLPCVDPNCTPTSGTAITVNALGTTNAINFALPPSVPTTISGSPNPIGPGGTLTVTWSDIAAPTSTDWVGLFPVGSLGAGGYKAWRYTTGTASGNVPLVVPVTIVPGSYELRLYSHDTTLLLATSAPITIVVPTLTASPAIALPGSTVTLTWANIGSPTSTDWIALYNVAAPDTSYIRWTYTTGTSSGSTTIVLPPLLPPGTYNFRLFAHDSLSRLAISNPITVPAVGLTAGPTVVAAGGTVSATWQSVGTPTPKDWLALFPVGSGSFVAWVWSTGQTDGTISFVLPNTLTAGTYEVRMFANDTTRLLGTSNSITVTASGPSISANPVLTAPGGTLTSTWKNMASPTPTDWVGLYPVGALDTAYISRFYTGGRANDRSTTTLPADLPLGTYELRLFANDSPTKLATSNQFVVSNGPTLTSAQSVSAGGTLDISWSGIATPTATDWVALIPLNGANTGYVAWTYTTGTASGSLSLAIPASVPIGVYEVRMFAADTVQRIALSNTVIVGPLLDVTPSPVAAGGTLTVTWSGIDTPTLTDWVALVPANSADNFYVAWLYATGRSSDSMTLAVPANVTPGAYDLRLFAHDTFVRLALSRIITVTAPGPALSVTPVVAGSGATLTAAWKGIAVPTATDWIGLYAAGAPDASYLVRTTTTGTSAGSTTLSVPPGSAPGQYELRLFANDTFTRLAISNSVAVRAGAVVRASPMVLVNPGALTVTWEGIATPTATDWIALVPLGGADNAYVAWVYTTGSALGTRSLVVPASVPGGHYEIRMFAHDTFTRIAVGNVITLNP